MVAGDDKEKHAPLTILIANKNAVGYLRKIKSNYLLLSVFSLKHRNVLFDLLPIYINRGSVMGV